MIHQYKNLTTGQKETCVQWLGDNLKEIIDFCGGEPLYVQKSPGDETAIMIPVQFRKDKRKKLVPIVWGEVSLGMWVSWNGSELFCNFENYDKSDKHIKLNY